MSEQGAAAGAQADPFADLRRAVLAEFPRAEVDQEVREWAGFRVPREDFPALARALRTMPGVECDYFSNLTGVDLKDRLQAVYHLVGLKSGAKVVLKVDVPYDDPVIDSVTEIWPGADWHEREAWDLLGIRFRNHPNLKRILLWEGYEGHPLRKDFVDRRPKRERLVRQR